MLASRETTFTPSDTLADCLISLTHEIGVICPIEGDTEGDAEGETERDMLGLKETETEGLTLGLLEFDKLGDGLSDGEIETETEGDSEGESDKLKLGLREAETEGEID